MVDVDVADGNRQPVDRMRAGSTGEEMMKYCLHDDDDS